MAEQRLTNNDADRKINPSEPIGAETVQPPASPGTDPTNPYNQEPTGEWIAHERASDRRNTEPGLTEADRRSRRM